MLAALADMARRHHGPLVVFGLAAALWLRVLLAHQLGAITNVAQLAPDEALYHAWAGALSRGAQAAAVDFPTLPASILSRAYALWGADPGVGRELNVAFGVLACALLYTSTRALYGRHAGLLALWLSAGTQSLAFYSATLLRASLGVCLVSLLQLCAAHGLRTDKPWRMLGLGGCALGLLRSSPGTTRLPPRPMRRSRASNGSTSASRPCPTRPAQGTREPRTECASAARAARPASDRFARGFRC